MIDERGFRKNVGIILTNSKGQVLVAKRKYQKSAWQFPQGGIDASETPEQALYREMKEELGLGEHDVELLAETKDWVSYKIPEKYQRRSAPCRGQIQKWFLLRLIADEDQIALDDCEEPEFDEWRWVDYWQPMDDVIAFKREVYKTVLEEFSSMVLKKD